MTVETAAAANDAHIEQMLQAADELEALSEALADQLQSLGEEHAAALRKKAYLLKG